MCPNSKVTNSTYTPQSEECANRLRHHYSRGDPRGRAVGVHVPRVDHVWICRVQGSGGLLLPRHRARQGVGMVECTRIRRSHVPGCGNSTVAATGAEELDQAVHRSVRAGQQDHPGSLAPAHDPIRGTAKPLAPAHCPTQQVRNRRGISPRLRNEARGRAPAERLAAVRSVAVKRARPFYIRLA
jgi:hypothetical protein